MSSRRDFFAGAVTAGTLTRILSGKAAQPSTPLNFSIPPHACDCHTHIFGDPSRFPLSPARVYTPEIASPAEMSALHQKLHIERVVIVTPSIYGADNSATLHGMKARGPNARGIAVIDDKTLGTDLDRMAKAGFRGVRINATTAGMTDPAAIGRRFEAIAARVKPLNWHVQMFTSLDVISAIKRQIRASPVPVVFDHFGGAQAARGLDQPGFSDLIELIRAGIAYVKISGAYLASTQAPDYPDVAPLAKALIAANPGRILWGTDWPHPNSTSPNNPSEVTPLRQIDDGRLLNQLAIWAPDPATRKKILVDNPSRLYQFI